MLKSASPTYRFLFWLGDTNLFIAIAAGACTLVTYAFHRAEPDFYLVGFIFSATLFTYNFQRRVGDLTSRETHKNAKSLLMLAGLAGMGALALRLSWIELAGLVIAGGISIGYAVPCIPFRGKWYSIREIPYMKIWAILLAWILGTALVPLLSMVNLADFQGRFNTFLFLVQQGAFIWALTVPFDVRDLNADRSSYRTLPMVLGVDKSIQLARTAMWLAFVFAFMNYLTGFIAFPEMLSQLVISAIGFYLVGRGRSLRDPLYYSIGLDGMIILQGLGVFMVDVLGP